jgi:uncharacterized BrkB/YihY/UPF0761 family membrane protein
VEAVLVFLAVYLAKNLENLLGTDYAVWTGLNWTGYDSSVSRFWSQAKQRTWSDKRFLSYFVYSIVYFVYLVLILIPEQQLALQATAERRLATPQPDGF